MDTLTKSRESQSSESYGHAGVLHSSSHFPLSVVFAHLALWMGGRGEEGRVNHPHLVTHSLHTHTHHTTLAITPTVSGIPPFTETEVHTISTRHTKTHYTYI